MPFYYGLIAGFALLGGVLRIGGRSPKKDIVFLLAAFLALGGLSAARYAVGIDYSYVYAPQYYQLLTTPGYSFGDTRFEPGFVLLELLLARFSPNYQMLFAVTGFLTVGLILLYYRRHSPNVFCSVFLFLALSQYYCSLNFIRQTLAGAIALFALPLLQKRRFHLYLPVVLLAASFHKSALILLPLYFFNLLSLTNKYVLAVISLGTLVVYCAAGPIVELITRFWYQSYHLQSEHLVSAFEFPFALAALVVLLLLLWGEKALGENRGNCAYLNYAFLAFFFILLGTRYSILDRLSVYFVLATPVSLPMLLEALAAKRGARSAAAALAACAVVVGSLAIHHFALSRDYHGVVPYRTVFTQPFYREYTEMLAWEESVRSIGPQSPVIDFNS